MAERHVTYCNRCGEVFDWGTKHECPMKRRDDIPFATVVESNLPMLDEVTGRVVAKFKAEVVDMENKAIVDAVIRAAQAEGITTMHLMDKQFIVDAIRNELRRRC